MQSSEGQAPQAERPPQQAEKDYNALLSMLDGNPTDGQEPGGIRSMIAKVNQYHEENADPYGPRTDLADLETQVRKLGEAKRVFIEKYGGIAYWQYDRNSEFEQRAGIAIRTVLPRSARDTFWDIFAGNSPETKWNDRAWVARTFFHEDPDGNPIVEDGYASDESQAEMRLEDGSVESTDGTDGSREGSVAPPTQATATDGQASVITGAKSEEVDVK